jgi:hypothetical protein
MLFALVHIEMNLLVGNAGSRHELTASSSSFDQPILKPVDLAPPVAHRLRRLRRLRLLTTGQNDRQRPAKTIVAAHKMLVQILEEALEAYEKAARAATRQV